MLKCQKLRVFCDFGVPEFVLRIVLTIRFASYGRFFERGKMSENRQKTSKIEDFLRFFHVRSNPLRESGCRVSKTEGFLRFWCARICPNDLFCYIRPSPRLSRGAPRWFQRGLKLTLFSKKGSEIFRTIHFESYGGSKLDEIVPTTCFATYGLSKAIPRRPVMVSEGFQRGLKPSLFFKEGSEMVV